MNLESIDDKTTCLTSAGYSLNSIYLLLEKLTDIEKNKSNNSWYAHAQDIVEDRNNLPVNKNKWLFLYIIHESNSFSQQ